MTANDIIQAAGEHLGTLYTGQAFNPDEAILCFKRLNSMLDEWNTQGINLFNRLDATLQLTANKQKYGIGPGAPDFGTQPRPVFIEAATYIMANGISQALNVMTIAEWKALKEQSLTGVLSENFYCDYGFPYSYFYLHPIPSGQGGAPSINLVTRTLLAAFPDLVTDVPLPPGYQKALETNLAINIAPDFHRQPTPELVQMAVGAKTNLQDLNRRFMGQLAAAGAPAPVPPASQTVVPQPPAAVVNQQQ